MNSYIGIDLGTSSVKLLLVSADGKILNSAVLDYPVYYPRSGWSEQNPEDWYSRTVEGLTNLLRGQDKKSVKGLSIGGQMHGLVMLDASGQVVRSAILWNDGRTQSQTDYLNNTVGREKLSQYTANIAFAGFTAPKILWVEQNEPDNFKKISKIMLPKDYLVYRLTGVFSTDFSDASGTLLLDVKNKRWSKKMCDICHVNEAWLPALHESYEPVATLNGKIAAALDLSDAVVVAAGAGDNAAAAIGTGAVDDGSCNLSLGTSGTVFISNSTFKPDNKNTMHSFCHANGAYHFLGCILSAASCNKWWVEDVLKSDYNTEFSGLEKFIGKNEVFFLPYLMGERCPHNDANARGVFFGLRPDTDRRLMSLAVLEGVAFALKDCCLSALDCAVDIKSAGVCGGGAKNKLWLQIIADVLNIELCLPLIEEGPAYGAAILAMTACGEFESVHSAVAALVKTGGTVSPNPENVKNYLQKYQTYKKLYPALKSLFCRAAPAGELKVD